VRRKLLVYRIYPVFLLIILILLLSLGWYISIALQDAYITSAKEDLDNQAQILEHQVRGRFSIVHQKALDGLCKDLGRATSSHITLYLSSGEVLADSSLISPAVEDHRQSPEVKAALAGNRESSIRYSDESQENILYVALPVMAEGKVLGAIRVGKRVSQITDAMPSVYKKIAVAGIFAAVFMLLACVAVSRRVNRSIAGIQEGAERFARGEFARKLRIPDIEELAALADTLNWMAKNLDEKIRSITRELNEREVILSSMQEGVLAVDVSGRVLTLNETAQQMFGTHLQAAKNRPLLEVIRNIDLRRFVVDSTRAGKPTEAEIVLPGPEERFLHVHGSILKNAGGDHIGTLVVMNDITRLRRLENMRREFFANFSHDIKTPVTSIMACVETLSDEGMNDPVSVKRFLEILARQTDRLNKLVEDVLTLSRVEWLEEKMEMQREEVNLHDLLDTVIMDAREKSSAQGVDIGIQCDPGLSVFVNPALLEQALANLLDNAIKYSYEGGTVTVHASRDGTDTVIKVIDRGCGMAKEHLSRIFERFYRVDKDRSRQSGGSGLGLAIVKHIVRAHGGTIEADSQPNKGSIFSIRLPDSRSR